MANISHNTFICAGCGDNVSVFDLSETSKDVAGTDSAVQAITLLPPEELFCKECDDDFWMDFEVTEDELAQDPMDAFNFCGVVRDPAMRQRDALNY